MVGIYLLTSPSGKHYIGQSINIKRRFSEYRRLRCKKQTILYNSLLKYGFENFSVTILEECPREKLSELEKYYIENPFYNVDCLLIKIYEEIYKNGIDKIKELCKQ